MKYGIVQEVMKVEERKAIRSQMATKQPQSPPRSPLQPHIQLKKNKDLSNVQNTSELKSTQTHARNESKEIKRVRKESQFTEISKSVERKTQGAD